MAAAIPIRIRQQIVEQRASGESYATISRGLAMPYMTVWKIDQQYRKSGRLEPHYERCRQTQIRKSLAIYERAIQLKGEHPGWGAGLIWVELAQAWPEKDVPSVRTLQRWFHRGRVARRPPERVAKTVIRRGQTPHEVWALDAKEDIRLADGSCVSWLTISDEGSGAVLATALFPLKRWNKVPPQAVKGVMQATMQAWGKPERVRMDNGSPWGTQSKLPSAFGLWLVGLGIGLTYGRPAHSTDNAVVERDHGVLAQWVEPQRCANFQVCQRQLDWATLTQRERYHLPGELTRLQAYPHLSSNPRSYDPTTDAQQWQAQKVRNYLAQFVFQRNVEANGRITLFANPYPVGKQYARQIVEVTLDPQTSQWVVSDDYHRPLRRHLARELSYTHISQLQLAKRRRP